MNKTCFGCKGAGVTIDFCRECQGDGIKSYHTGEVCSRCDGSGHEENKCMICWGSGENDVFNEGYIH